MCKTCRKVVDLHSQQAGIIGFLTFCFLMKQLKNPNPFNYYSETAVIAPCSLAPMHRGSQHSVKSATCKTLFSDHSYLSRDYGLFDHRFMGNLLALKPAPNSTKAGTRIADGELPLYQRGSRRPLHKRSSRSLPLKSYSLRSYSVVGLRLPPGGWSPPPQAKLAEPPAGAPARYARSQIPTVARAQQRTPGRKPGGECPRIAPLPFQGHGREPVGIYLTRPTSGFAYQSNQPMS